MVAASMLLVVLIWGLNFSVSKWSLGQFPPLGFTALRFVLASVLLAAVLRWVEGPLKLPTGAFWRLVGLGTIGNTLYQMGFILGLERTTATNSSLVLASMPAMVAAFGAALGIERPTANGRRGLILASLGVILVIAVQGVRFSAATLGGDLLTLAGVVCWAAFTLGVRRLALPLSPLAITAWTLMLGTPALVLAGLPELIAMDWTRVTWLGWTGLVYSSALSLVVAYVIWNRSVRVVGSNRTAVFTCMTPLVAMAAAMLILGERPSVIQLLGGGMILAGVILAQRMTRGTAVGAGP